MTHGDVDFAGHFEAFRRAFSSRNEKRLRQKLVQTGNSMSHTDEATLTTSENGSPRFLDGLLLSVANTGGTRARRRNPAKARETKRNTKCAKLKRKLSLTLHEEHETPVNCGDSYQQRSYFPLLAG